MEKENPSPKKPEPHDPPEKLEPDDYYIENGLLVLTEHYLKRRGYCCENDCRHCPY